MEYLAEMSNKPKSKIPNNETLEAIKELDEDGGHYFESIDDFWKQVGIDPKANYQKEPTVKLFFTTFALKS